METNYIQDMIDQIDSYNNDQISLGAFLDNAEGIYNILECDSSEDFKTVFHATWDVLDEINATDGEKANASEIKNVIMPKFAADLQRLLA